MSPHHHADPAAARFLPWLSHLYRGECTWKREHYWGARASRLALVPSRLAIGSLTGRLTVGFLTKESNDAGISPWGLVGHRGRDETGLSLQNNNSLRSDQERRRGLARLGQLFGGTTQSTGMLQRTGGGVLAQLERGV